nr:immunoglobulin heavy chain junction region [Macaca mulatta]MOY19022.1 immunoglobulin heavy chain junction region [Macaca mulatta]MOY19134.1 immunoglobulin heavy chain junction region [Macaca mulatta]MOY19617.1 immunoglobulin heavy chain junction region [Macaca mulatta]MOY20201.1 immunoglobulin heavy chain junction region [Macaca mulatta]
CARPGAATGLRAFSFW